MEEERPNLRPRLNKALREIERLKQDLALVMEDNRSLHAQLVLSSMIPDEQWEALAATADLKPEQDS